MRIVISEPKSGKSYQVELPKDKEPLVIGKKIGDSLDGGELGAAGYELEFTGGSDTSGFPMRADVSGTRKAELLLSDGSSFHTKRKGERKRKMVRGNTYSGDIMQVNAVVKKAGATPLDQLFKKEEKEEKKE